MRSSLPLSLGLLAACASGPAGTPTSAANVVAVTQFNATPNPTGLKLGFWEVVDQQPVTLSYFGKRPTSRVGFDAWDQIELTKGQYTFPASADDVIRVHKYGETAYTAVNIAFTHLITKGKQTIPTFYAHNNGGTDTDIITDPVTRQAAKDFLYAYVQWLLGQVGNVTLTIDYEIVSNYRLAEPGSQDRARSWADWYVEAAGVAQRAAKDMGRAGSLKLMPIVNGDVLDPTNPIHDGPSKNAWLVDVVAASDALALDTYHCDPALAASDPANPQYTLDTLKFWIDNYAGGKDVIVTENGFTSATSRDPNITEASRGYKYTGTEAQQADYYKRLLPLLKAGDKPGGVFGNGQTGTAFANRLRSVNFWSIADNTRKQPSDGDFYFGLYGVYEDAKGNVLSTAPKPAMAQAQAGFASIESDPTLRPVNLNTGTDVSGLLTGGDVALTYTNGDKYQFLRYTESALPKAATYTLKVTTGAPGSVIANVNGHWLYLEGGPSFAQDVTAYCTPGAPATIDLYFTGAVFPLVQHVKKVTLAKS